MFIDNHMKIFPMYRELIDVWGTVNENTLRGAQIKANGETP